MNNLSVFDILDKVREVDIAVYNQVTNNVGVLSLMERALVANNDKFKALVEAYPAIMSIDRHMLDKIEGALA